MLERMTILLKICYDINEVKGYSAFFDFSGHVYSAQVRVYKVEEEEPFFQSYLYLAGDLKCDDEDYEQVVSILKDKILSEIAP